MATQIDYRLMNKEFLLDPVFSDLPCYNDDYIKCIFQFQTKADYIFYRPCRYHC